MSKPRDLHWLKDIERAIEKIERHPKYKEGRAAYNEDEYFRDVVYLNVERICEAATHLVREFSYDKKYPDLPWEEMLGMRIVVSHYYWKINDDVIWDTVERDFPMFKNTVTEWRRNIEVSGNDDKNTV
jgi:uncharacterized protein with HEPN domain